MTEPLDLWGVHGTGPIKLGINYARNAPAFCVIDQLFRVRDELYLRDWDRLTQEDNSRAIFHFTFEELVQGLFASFDRAQFTQWFKEQVDDAPQSLAFVKKLDSIPELPVAIPCDAGYGRYTQNPQALFLRNAQGIDFQGVGVSRFASYNPRVTGRVSELEPLVTPTFGRVEKRFVRAIKADRLNLLERQLVHAQKGITVLLWDSSDTFSESTQSPQDFLAAVEKAGFDNYIDWALYRHEEQNKRWFPYDWKSQIIELMKN